LAVFAFARSASTDVVFDGREVFTLVLMLLQLLPTSSHAKLSQWTTVRVGGVISAGAF
jgi:hypothetical protein